MQLRFSQDLKALLRDLAQRPLTLADILAQTSERGFSLVISLLVLPFLLPMPPGVTMIFGSGCLLLAGQMALGRRSPWLPRWIAQFRFPRRLSLQLLNQVQRVIRWLEKITRPRLLSIATSRSVWRLNGVCIAWLTILLMSPMPFTNPIPTIGILLFAVAMLETDGLLMLLSYGLTLLITLLFGGAFYVLLRSPALLENLLS